MKRSHHLHHITAAALLIVLIIILWRMFSPIPELHLQG